MTKRADGEAVALVLYEKWLSTYGPQKHLHSGNAVRLFSETSWYQTMLKKVGVEYSFGVPYGRRHNPLSERMNRNVEELFRILRLDDKSKNWVRLVPMVEHLNNNMPCGSTNISPYELFFGRPCWTLQFPYPTEGNPRVEEYLDHQQQLADQAKTVLEHVRNRYLANKNKRRVEATYEVGDRVLVHHERLPRWKRTKIDCPYFGPFRVLEVKDGSLSVRCSPRHGGVLTVGFTHLKHYWEEELLDDDTDEYLTELRVQMEAAQEDEMEGVDEEDDDPEPDEPKAPDVQEVPPENPVMTKEEMEKKGYFLVSGILRHTYERGWRFLTTWKGYGSGDATWEPPKTFVLGGGEVNEVFKEHCEKHGLKAPLSTATRISKKTPKKRAV